VVQRDKTVAAVERERRLQATSPATCFIFEVIILGVLMQVTIVCEAEQDKVTVEGGYSKVRAGVTNFLMDHNHEED